MNIVDSSGWLEYFAESKNVEFFADAIEDAEHLLVPVICIYEVFKRLTQLRGLSVAQTHIGDMHAGRIVDIDESLVLSAAQISIEKKLPMADSLILATARTFHATLWTQDEHFQGMVDVKYVQK
jgi:toxin FitB